MRKTPVFLLLLLVFLQLACARTTTVRRQERATTTALAAQTATAYAQALAEGKVGTPTPECRTNMFGLGCRPTRTPKPPTPTATPLPTPTMVHGLRVVTTKGQAAEYHNYYEDPSDSRQMGVISGGVELVVVEERHNGRYIQVLMMGTMEMGDLGYTEGNYPTNPRGLMAETTCIRHSWGHVDGRQDCHAHFWCGDQVCATIPEKLTYVIDSTSVSDHRVQVRLVPLVWVEGRSVK